MRGRAVRRTREREGSKKDKREGGQLEGQERGRAVRRTREREGSKKD